MGRKKVKEVADPVPEVKNAIIEELFPEEPIENIATQPSKEDLIRTHIGEASLLIQALSDSMGKGGSFSKKIALIELEKIMKQAVALSKSL